MKTILVPTDFSAHAGEALRAAASLARKSGSELVLLHANDIMAYTTPLIEYYEFEKSVAEIYEEKVNERFDKILNEVTNDSAFAGIPIRTAIRVGTLVDVLDTVIQEEGADLVVMGTLGATGSDEFMVGSNTQKVIRRASCPILTIPLHVDSTNFFTVVFPSTLKDDQVVSFQFLADFQRICENEVYLLYLNNPADLPDDGAIEARAYELAEEAGLTLAGVYTAKESIFNEEEAILNFASEQKASLIAMGTHQRRGLSHLLFGSVTEDTISHARIPVMSIPLQMTFVEDASAVQA
ncbi:universal stress protein [Nibrella saemangeumensis]|uniref:Universal stress protein n=1 Tax=Nibrella saemangeumensis TaxID=1084526 RepID=A0ABP8MAB4_9BACT